MKQHLSVVCLVLALASSGKAQGGPDGLTLVTRMIQKCGRLSELGTCLRMKAVTVLDRAIHAGPLDINEYLSLAPERGAVNASNPLSEKDLEASLPSEQSQRVSALDDMIAEKLSTFVKSRSIKFRMPEEEDESNSINPESRSKKEKKYYGAMAGVGMMFGGFMIQLALGTLAVLAGKALVIAKMALLLASIIGLKKLVSSEGGESHQVIYAGGHESGGHDWGRVAIAQDRAYSAHVHAHGRQR